MWSTHKVPENRSTSPAAWLLRVIAMILALALASRASGQSAPQSAPPSPPTLEYAAGHDAKVSGFIISRRGDNLLVRDETTGQLSMVSVSSATKVDEKAGWMDMETKRKGTSDLMPGLKIKVKGIGSATGNLIATKISFHGRSSRVAEQISAGEVELKAQQRQTAAIAAANRDSIAAAKERARDSLSAMSNTLNEVNARISNLANYDVRDRATVNFALNSFELSKSAMETLDGLVAKNGNMDTFIFEVEGFTDTTGSMAHNQKLSNMRANVVVSYLTDKHNIPLRRIATPSGLGPNRPVAPNETSGGRALNRRVEVQVLVNKGLKPPPMQ